MANEVTIVVSAKDNASQVFAKIEDKGRGVAGMFGDIAKFAGGFVLSAGLLKLPGLFSSAVSAGSDFAETLSKSNTIFGSAGKDIEDWASTAAKGFGQSKQQALDAAATFGNLFVQLGSGSQDAARMSTQMVELASDFASFHNAAPTDVIIAMTAAFRGEYDAVQRYVPVINAAAVEQHALKMGLAKTTKELTAQDKALAVQALLIAGAGDAMGDFDRTAAGAANRTRVLQAQMADLRQEVGTALLPVVLSVGSVLMDKVAPAMQAVGSAIAPAVGHLVTFARFLHIAATEGAATNDVADLLPERFRTIAHAVGEVVVWVRDELIPAFQGFVAMVAPKLEEFAQIAGEKFAEFGAYYEASIKPALDNIATGFMAVVNVIRENWPAIMEVVGPIIEQVRIVIETAFGVISGVLNAIIQLIGGDFSGAWDSMKDVAQVAMDGVKASVDNGLELLRGLLSAFFELGVELVRKIIEGIKAAPGAISSALKDEIPTPGGILSGIGNALKGAPGAFADAKSGIGEGIVGGLSTVGSIAKDEFAEARRGGVNQNNSIGTVINNFPAGVTQEEGEDIFVLGLQRAGLEAVN